MLDNVNVDLIRGQRPRLSHIELSATATISFANAQAAEAKNMQNDMKLFTKINEILQDLISFCSSATTFGKQTLQYIQTSVKGEQTNTQVTSLGEAEGNKWLSRSKVHVEQEEQGITLSMDIVNDKSSNNSVKLIIPNSLLNFLDISTDATPDEIVQQLTNLGVFSNSGEVNNSGDFTQGNSVYGSKGIINSLVHAVLVKVQGMLKTTGIEFDVDSAVFATSGDGDTIIRRINDLQNNTIGAVQNAMPGKMQQGMDQTNKALELQKNDRMIFS